MTPGSILTIVDGGPHSDSAMKTAISVGKLFKSYIEVLHVETPPEAEIAPIAEGASGALIEEILASARARSQRRTKKARQIFETRVARAGVPVVSGLAKAKKGRMSAAWRATVGDERAILSSRGRLFDLLVFARAAEREGGVDAVSLQSALFLTGKPVLVSGNKPDGIGRSVVVGWDGSREAARSVSAALPFLAQAKKITVLTVVDKNSSVDPKELAGHLSLIGANVRAVSVPRAGNKIGAVLLGECKRRGADLLIMGAYGHSALREFIFGGVTRDILRTGTVPLLMAH